MQSKFRVFIRSASGDYGDNAIGYVKIKRIESVCTVHAKITPQTSVNNSPYDVSVDVDEKMKIISNATCTCQASAGNFVNVFVMKLFLFIITLKVPVSITQH